MKKRENGVGETVNRGALEGPFWG